MKAYLQGANGEEVECTITQPEPSEEHMIDKCVQIPIIGILMMNRQKDAGYWWIRIIG
jgi:hypothetical protein